MSYAADVSPYCMACNRAIRYVCCCSPVQRTQPLPNHGRPFHHRSGSAETTTEHQGRQSHWTRRHCSQSHAGVDLAPVLTTIFTQSINTESVPDDWKKANVIPIFKKGSKYSPSNYRPVSLTCISCKVMEHIMVSNIMDHFDNHNILFHNQHGFRGKLSCETQLIQLTDDIAHTLDRRKQADLLILDFSKAFDKVPHRRLAHNLDWYGVRNKSLAWITAFLDPTSAAGRRYLNTEASLKRGPTGHCPGPRFVSGIHQRPARVDHQQQRKTLC